MVHYSLYVFAEVVFSQRYQSSNIKCVKNVLEEIGEWVLFEPGCCYLNTIPLGSNEK